ncbi:UNVERIFIED_CONTAM: Copia protein [Sesamum latifolium]|uniref:Copia protein n=1 Tax=Sesamum latifolium TaxID=2727402 RepID=A0AAW2WXV7_9LAMI
MVLVREASTSKVKGKRAGRWKRKKGKGKAVAATASAEAPLLLLRERAKGRLEVLSGRRQMMSACIAKERGIGRGSIHNSSSTQVLERSRRLSKDEMILRLGDGKAVVAEAAGSLSLVISDHIRVELKDCYYVPIMIKNIISVPVLENDDVCGPLNTPARGGYSYFITFTDDNSRYGYVYLIRYKSKAFERFKEYKFKVENQTGRRIKALRSDRGREYLSGEFIDYLKKNGILSQWTPPGTPQLNGVAERRNRTLLDMVRSMMSFTKLPHPSGVTHLRRLPSCLTWRHLRWYTRRLMRYGLASLHPTSLSDIRKKLGDITSMIHPRKKIFISRNAVVLEKDFPTDSQLDEVLLEESSEAPQQNDATSFEPSVPTDGVLVLHRSTRESRPPERYGFVELTSRLDSDPRTYGQAMSDIDSDKWLEAMKSEMDSMGSNQVWTLVNPPKGVRPAGCKWVYKRKLGAEGEVTAFKARLVAKGYTQLPEVDFEETYSPVTMTKSIRILLAKAAWYDYEIWQMGVKTAFLDGFIEEEIFMD